MTQPTIALQDAQDVCAKPWLTEAKAHEQALLLQRGGWRIEWRNHPEFGASSGVFIVATVHYPNSGSTVGDITYRLETEA